jgi:hypothetical protein
MTELGAVIRKGEHYAQINDRLEWVNINYATVFSSTYKAGIALQALREQGFDVRKMCIAQVKVITSVMETGV